MHTHRKGIFWSIRLLAVLFAVFLVISRTETASADPHALFYTTTGQQQLFFNVLSALNQSDYVEPAEQSPATPPGNSRQEILEQRGEEGFGPETDPVVNSTKTDLASVLTRSITLEGNDLWTAYLSHQFAIEAARRNATDEVLRIYCERGLGLEACEDDAEDPKESEPLREKAFIVDVTKRALKTFSNGVLGVLLSSYDPSSIDQQRRKDAIRNDNNGEEAAYPIPFNDSVAALRANGQDADYKADAIERITAAVGRSFGPAGVDSTSLDELSFSNGKVQLFSTAGASSGVSAGSDPEYIDRYTRSLASLVTLPVAITSAAREGAQTVAQFQDAAEEGGAVADTYAVPQAVSTSGPQNVAGIFSNDAYAQANNNSSFIRGVDARIQVPAHAKIAATQEALGTLGSAEENLKYAPTEAESRPGTTELVNRGQSTGQTQGATTSGGHVQGTSTGSTTEGNVAGIISPNFFGSDDSYHEEKPVEYNPNTNPISFSHEQGPAHLLQAVGYKNDSGGCGCSKHSAINDHGQAVLSFINRR